MTTNTKIKLGAVAAAALALAGGGVALAATEPWNAKEEAQAVIDDAAQQLGVEPQELSDALKRALKNRVDDAVAAGRLTEGQGAELKKRIDASEVPLPFGVFGPKAFGFGPGPDHVGPLGSLSTAADFLGLSEAELRSRLADGKTLAQIAKAEGKSVDGLVQALLDDAEEKLDAAVDAGKLTRDEADQIRAEWKERITDFVNGDTPFGFHFGFDRDGFGFREHFEHRFGGAGGSPWLRPGPSA